MAAKRYVFASLSTVRLLWFFAVFPLPLFPSQHISHNHSADSAQEFLSSPDSSSRISLFLPVIEFGTSGKPSLPNVTKQILYWIDTAQTMTIKRIVFAEDNQSVLFRKADALTMNHGYHNSTIWLKFRLQRLPKKEIIQQLVDSISSDIKVQNSLNESLRYWVLALGNKSADTAQLYIISGKSVIYADTIGYSVPYHQWRVSSTELAFPLPVAIGQTVECYVRMHINGIMYYGVKLQPQSKYAEKEFNIKIPLILFYGVALFAVIFSLLSWILTRSRYYGLYAFYIVCLALSISIDAGHFYQVFEVSMPHLNNRLYILSWLASMAMGVFFVWEFVREQHSIAIPKIWEWLAYLFWACCLVALVAEFVDMRGVTLNVLYYSYLALAVPTTLGMSFSAWRAGYRPALYVFVARAIVEFGIAANSLAALGLLSYSSIWISQISLLVPAVEMMLMGLALADRITVLQRLKQEAERRALRGELYRVQNEELSAANEEISRQQSEIMQQAMELQEMNTQVTLLNDELQQQNAELAEANREKSEILNIVAHDLKNPIGSVRGMAELIETGFIGDTEKTASARQIIGTSERMLDLVKKLLDINMLESGAFQMDFYAFDIIPLLDMLVEQYTAPAAAKQIAIRCEYQISRGIILANEQAVMQILDNIVSNAVKYSPHGKNIVVRIKAAGETVEDVTENVVPSPSSFVRIEVQDEGPGLSEDDKAKLFGKFVRLSAQPTGGEHSTGLGLSIVKRMVEAMKGEVWCESERGEGATFIVQLPISVSEASSS